MSKISMRVPALAFSAIGLLMASGAGWAADSTRAGADAQYKIDVAACKSGKTGQVQQACMAEAASARDETVRNRLNQGNGQFEQNRTARCAALPAADQAACVAQMSGQGSTQGSVPSGGVMREITVPATGGTGGTGVAPANPGMGPSLTPAPMR